MYHYCVPCVQHQFYVQQLLCKSSGTIPSCVDRCSCSLCNLDLSTALFSTQYVFLSTDVVWKVSGKIINMTLSLTEVLNDCMCRQISKQHETESFFVWPVMLTHCLPFVECLKLTDYYQNMHQDPLKTEGFLQAHIMRHMMHKYVRHMVRLMIYFILFTQFGFMKSEKRLVKSFFFCSQRSVLGTSCVNW